MRSPARYHSKPDHARWTTEPLCETVTSNQAFQEGHMSPRQRLGLSEGRGRARGGGAIMVALGLIVAGCGGTSGRYYPADGAMDAQAPGDGGGHDLLGMPMNCTGISKSQGLSQPCCQEFGIDACGAGLFCAAFDGRTQATCYPEHSRMALTQCDEDRDCASSACETMTHKCKSLPGEMCDTGVGCAAAMSNQYICQPETMKCVKKGAGICGDNCASNADCIEGRICYTGASYPWYHYKCTCDQQGDSCNNGPCPDGSVCESANGIWFCT
jgi:hypothetical protein